MPNPICLLCLDVDGTLLDSRLQLRKNVIDALHHLDQAGIAVAIVTGRNLDSTLSIANSLAIPLSIVSSNGGHIRTLDGRTREIGLKPSQVPEIVQAGLGAGSGLFIDRPERSWTFGDEYWIGQYADVNNGTPASDLSLALSPAPIKISIINEARLLEGIRSTLAQRYPDLQMSAPFPTVLDVTPQQASKGQALHTLGAMLGIPSIQIAAVGDSENDLSIFREAGLSIAMRNAPADIRAEADWIAPSNDEEGVAWAVERIIETNMQLQKAESQS